MSDEAGQSKANGDAFEEELRLIALSQDRAAFERLFRYYAPCVKAYLMKLGSDAAFAEEVTQEAMATVWRKACLFDPKKASASTWIFTIARNRRIDAFRRERRPEIDPNDPALVPDDAPSPDQSISVRQMSERMRDAVAALPAEQQEVLRLSFYADIAHAEISDRLGIPLGTVKSRLRLAFQRLRSAMADHQGGS